MNKLLKFSIAFFFILVMSVSCQRKDETLDAPLLRHQFSVEAELPGIEQEPDTKGYLGSYISASWTKGDKVSVVNLTKGNILGGDLTADGDGTRTIFSGQVTGTIAKGDVIALVYPSFGAETETEFGDDRKINLSEQNGSNCVKLVACTTFTADKSGGEFSGLNLHFDYALSYLKINMANLPSSASVSKITIRNVPVEFTLSINGAKSGLDVATDAEKAAKGVITMSGSFSTSATGAMVAAVGVMPSDMAENRSIVVTVDGDGDYLSPLTSAELAVDKYYNTVASGFEKINLSGKSAYGVYNVSTGEVIDEYAEFTSTIVTGTENGESDFSLLNTSGDSYWTLKGIPSDATEGTTFTARFLSYDIAGYPEGTLDGAGVRIIEQDGDWSKLWVKAGDYLFIVRK